MGFHSLALGKRQFPLVRRWGGIVVVIFAQVSHRDETPAPEREWE